MYMTYIYTVTKIHGWTTRLKLLFFHIFSGPESLPPSSGSVPLPQRSQLPPNRCH